MKRIICFCFLWALMFFHAVESLAADAPRVIKATVLSEEKTNGWEKLDGRFYRMQNVKLRLISTISGDAFPNEINTRLAFPLNRKFLLNAKRLHEQGSFLQRGENYLLWLSPEKLSIAPDTQEILDALMTTDAALVEGNMQDVAWQEIKKLADNADIENGIYSFRWLKEHADRDFYGTSNRKQSVDFEALSIIKFLQTYWMAANEKVAFAAINNSSVFPLGKDLRSPEYRYLVPELIKVADTHPSPIVRSEALRSLSYVHEPAVEAVALRQVQSDSPLTKSYGISLLSGFSNESTRQQLKNFAAEPEPKVRQAVASVAGYMKAESLIPTLVRYLIDENQDVRATAARSLLAYAPRSVLREQIDNKEFGSLFLNKVAVNNVGAFLPHLAAQVTKEKQVNASWNLLFDYVQTKSRETLESPEGQSVLDALESVTQDDVKLAELYKFYLMRQMTERAANFQAEMKKRNQAAAFNEMQRIDQDRTLQEKFAQTPRVD